VLFDPRQCAFELIQKAAQDFQIRLLILRNKCAARVFCPISAGEIAKSITFDVVSACRTKCPAEENQPERGVYVLRLQEFPGRHKDH
jgi:hypothetical protein